MAPDSLRGVPVERISETSSYWEQTWSSLDAFIAQEPEEKRLKEIYHARRLAEPGNQSIQSKAKLHQDNMSKHVKIREVFGANTPYHPNQLVAKKHIPSEGLCQKELMYRVACKISDLKVLNDQGVLAMDAWDFIRWRISRKLTEKLDHPGLNGKNFVRTIIYKLCDEPKNDNTGYADPVMREAVLFSARYQNRIANFKTDGSKACAPRAKSTRPTKRTRQVNRVRRSRLRTNLSTEQADTARREEERQAERRERRAQLEAQSGSYQGVNAFRQMQQDRKSQE